MSIRSIIHNRLSTAPTLLEFIPADLWLSSSSITDDNRPGEPRFAVMRFGVVSAGMAQVRRQSLEIWYHDVPGSYTNIDSLIAKTHGILDGVVHLKDSDGNELMSADWVSDSGDLYDPGFRTIVKTTTYDLLRIGV